MTPRENMIRCARFDYPESIPVSMGIGNSCWTHYDRHELWEHMADHPILFPDFVRPGDSWTPSYVPWRRADKPYTDSWGCVWNTTEDGITGGVVEHAIPDWSKLTTYIPPSPENHNGWGGIDWNEIRGALETAHNLGHLAAGSLRHGHTFLTLTYIRGYEHAIYDMADNEPALRSLLSIIEAFNLGLVQRFLDAGIDWMGYPEDLGMQCGPMLSPTYFEKYIVPIYRRLIAPARKAGAVIHMHSDGDIRELCENLIDVGIEVLNLQDLVNGIDWIRDHLKGRICIDLDIDRQNITRFGSPSRIAEHVAKIVETLGDPAGGLMLKFGLFHGTPIENVKAVMDAMEKASTFFA
jgi:uroporphyrinogen decarboxylase